jgi:hypothetical protein
MPKATVENHEYQPPISRTKEGVTREGAGQWESCSSHCCPRVTWCTPRAVPYKGQHQELYAAEEVDFTKKPWLVTKQTTISSPREGGK